MSAASSKDPSASASQPLLASHPNADGSLNRNNIWEVPWGSVAAILTVLSTELFTFGLLGILSSVFGAEGLYQLVLLYTCAGVVTVAGVSIMLATYHYPWKRFFGKPGIWIIFIPLYFVLYTILTNIATQVADRFPNYDSSQAQDFGFNSVSGLGLVGVFFVLVLLPPLTEEILFRGVLYRGLRSKWGRVISAVVVSGLFGLLHGQWNVGIDTFILSLVLILAFEQTKTLWTPIGIHMVKNFIAFLVLFVFHL